MLTLRNAIILLNGRQKVLNSFESGIFPKEKQGKEFTGLLDRLASSCIARLAKVSDREFSDRRHLKTSASKKMLRRLPIAILQVKAGSKSENLLNEISQIICSLNRAKETTKKVFNNIINSIRL